MSDERSDLADIFLGAVPPVPEDVTAALLERTFAAPPDAGDTAGLLPAWESAGDTEFDAVPGIAFDPGPADAWPVDLTPDPPDHDDATSDDPSDDGDLWDHD